MLNIIFYTALFLILYTYILFPLLLFLIVKLKRKLIPHIHKSQIKLPAVAIVCAMYNEEKIVGDKLANFYDLKYDGELRLYVGSDGSTDKTNEILAEYAKDSNRIFTYIFPRRGKVHVLNDVMHKVKEEIVVFTDANSMFTPAAITNLVRNFDDPSIGAVCGRLKLIDGENKSGEGFYWRFETAIKKLESELNCVIGANGAIYAVRRELFRSLPANTINDDFTISMRVVEQGLGIKYAQDAVACERVDHGDAIEFKRHVRDGAGHYRAMLHLYRLFNPFKTKSFFLYMSHRVIRWIVPFLLVLLMILPTLTDNSQITLLYQMEIVFYILVFIGWITKTKIKIFYIPFYFIYINTALMIGFIRNIVGLQKVTWNRTER